MSNQIVEAKILRNMFIDDITIQSINVEIISL